MNGWQLTDLSTADPAFAYHLRRATADEVRAAIAKAEGRPKGQVVRLRALRGRLRMLERKAAKEAA